MNATTDLALTLGIPEHVPLFAVDRLGSAAPTAGPNVTGPRLLHRLNRARGNRRPRPRAGPVRHPRRPLRRTR